jgi:predicted AlkP superfamily phosphohydrolase/phosphomutase
MEGRLLSGMGVPDLRGGFGTATYYATDGDLAPRESEQVVSVSPDSSGAVSTYLIGPRHPRDRSDLRAEMTVRPGSELGTVLLRVAGGDEELLLREGCWSDWLRIRFKAGLLQSIRGLVRFLLVRRAPDFALYASPVQFDPEEPMFPISAPARFAGELAGAIGPYATAGMIEDHAGLSNGRIDEAAFLDQCNDTWRERANMMLSELDRFDQGLFFCLFDTPDRVQHMFWRFREPDHPSHRGAPFDPELGRAIEEQYRRADAVVGMALERADDETLVIAMSDHGFGGFRRGVDLNRWLWENGLLALKPGVEPGPGAGDQFREVDWGRTRAYAMGLGGIYLNLQDREGSGIVSPAEADSLRQAIVKGLTGLQDPQGGAVAIRGVATREQLYAGPLACDSPDLVVHFAEGFRVSWASSLGGSADSLFEDNVKKWGGDHVVDPSLVPGVLFLDRPFRGERARLLDLAPTILEALGVPGGPDLEGSSLLS